MTTSHHSRSLGNTVRYSPLLWAVGLSSIAYQAIVFYDFLRRRNKLRNPSKLQTLVLLYCALYLFSITFAAISGADSSRILAALYNLSIWFAGALSFGATRIFDVEWLRKSARLTLIFLLVTSIAAFLAFSNSGSVEFKSLIGSALGSINLPENLAANTNLRITASDWSTLGLGSRLAIMAPYPTALGMLGLVLVGLAAPAKWNARSLVKFSPYIVIGFVLAYLCASRATMGSITVFVISLGVFLAARIDGSANFKIFVVLAGGASLIICALTLQQIAASAWSSINEVRAGSSSVRFELYALSVKSAWEQHPLIGFGVKERIAAYAIPLGSHSTIFGSMYKTGIIGFSLMCILFTYTAYKCVRTGLSSGSTYRAGVAAAVLAMLPLLVFEDIDAIPLVAFLFFISLGIVEHPYSEDADTAEAP